MTMTPEVRKRLDKLHAFLRSDDLHIDGRIFILKEIWDINKEIATFTRGDYFKKLRNI